MIQYFLIGIGAAIGAVARYDFTKLVNNHKMTGFPTATLVINWLGALLLGILTARLISQPNWLVFLGTGLCGGFTTFSTMANECLSLLQEKAYLTFAWYLGLTLVGGISLAALGFLV